MSADSIPMVNVSVYGDGFDNPNAIVCMKGSRRRMYYGGSHSYIRKRESYKNIANMAIRHLSFLEKRTENISSKYCKESIFAYRNIVDFSVKTVLRYMKSKGVFTGSGGRSHEAIIRKELNIDQLRLNEVFFYSGTIYFSKKFSRKKVEALKALVDQKNNLNFDLDLTKALTDIEVTNEYS